MFRQNSRPKFRLKKAHAFIFIFTVGIVAAFQNCGQFYAVNSLNENASSSADGLGVLRASGASAGYEHTCAVVSGALQCWGSNESGQLGDGGTIDKSSPVTVIGSGVTSVSAGSEHTCAVVSGALQCWGRNSSGQLGDGGAIHKSSPVTVISSGVTSVSAGGDHTCAVVSGALQCWGDNGSGQLGDGSAWKTTPQFVRP